MSLSTPSVRWYISQQARREGARLRQKACTHLLARAEHCQGRDPDSIARALDNHACKVRRFHGEKGCELRGGHPAGVIPTLPVPSVSWKARVLFHFDRRAAQAKIEYLHVQEIHSSDQDVDALLHRLQETHHVVISLGESLAAARVPSPGRKVCPLGPG
eukprot:8756439-Pyramimonas_sp.AAC.1